MQLLGDHQGFLLYRYTQYIGVYHSDAKEPACCGQMMLVLSGYIQNFPWLLMPVLCNVIKTIINHPPVITMKIGGIFLSFPVMGGLWHCLNHITGYTSGKHTKNFGTSPCYEWEHPLIHYFSGLGQIFNGFLYVYQRVVLYITTMWGPQDSVQLVNITPMSLWFMVRITYNELVTGANLNQRSPTLW